MNTLMNEPGYERLADVFQRAYDQAARGKGKDRHANGEPFDKQVMQDGARRFGHGSLLFQAFKKSEESQRLPHDRAIAELLGAMVYLGGAVIALENARATLEVDAALVGPELAWHGGNTPVAGTQLVQIRVRGDGYSYWSPRPHRADSFTWLHSATPSDTDIVAYRVVN